MRSGAEQDFGDRAVGTAVHSRIERAKRQRQSMAALRRKTRGTADRAHGRSVLATADGRRARAIRSRRRAATRPRRSTAITGGSFSHKRCSTPRNAKHGVPAVGRLPQISRRQIAAVEADATCRREAAAPDEPGSPSAEPPAPKRRSVRGRIRRGSAAKAEPPPPPELGSHSGIVAWRSRRWSR